MTTTASGPAAEARAIDEDVLANPVWHALVGPHATYAEGEGGARRYRPDISPFSALADENDPAAWVDLARLVGPGGTAVLTGRHLPLPPGWDRVEGGAGVQLVAEDLPEPSGAALVPLGPDDVPEMLGLVARTRPGPFLPATVELGGYLGYRDEQGRLVAMAGRRLNPPGHVEISAVCTDSAYRGRGLASRLVLAVAAGIRAEGQVPFLHAAASNTNAVRLYESLGFRLRRRPVFEVVRSPAG